MKKLLAILLTCTSFGYASNVSYSSTTLSNETLQTLRSATSTNTVVQQLTAVIVGSATIGGLLKIFNSSFTTTASTVTIINMGVTGYYPFFDVPLKGITYTTTGNSNGVTIIYKY